MQKVHFYFSDRTPTLKQRRRLKLFIETIFVDEKKKLGYISYIFCSDKYLLEINQNFLHHDYYTDVITFNLSNTMEYIEGEVYISIDRVKDNASKQGVYYRDELYRVIFHGTLHLCGYKDKSASDIQIMRKKEDKYLFLYLK